MWGAVTPGGTMCPASHLGPGVRMREEREGHRGCYRVASSASAFASANSDPAGSTFDIEPRRPRVSTITSKSGKRFYYRTAARAPIVTFSHGWLFSSQLGASGTARCFSSRRRASVSLRMIGAATGARAGPSQGTTWKAYADDLAAAIGAFDLRDRRERAAHASA